MRRYQFDYKLNWIIIISLNKTREKKKKTKKTVIYLIIFNFISFSSSSLNRETQNFIRIKNSRLHSNIGLYVGLYIGDLRLAVGDANPASLSAASSITPRGRSFEPLSTRRNLTGFCRGGSLVLDTETAVSFPRKIESEVLRG